MDGMDERDRERAIGSFVALGDSFTEGLNDPGPDGGFLGWADRVAAALAQQLPGFRYANLAVRGKLLGQVVDGQVPRAAEMAPGLRGIADAYGCDVVDLWSMRALHDQRAWSADRLHLSAEGHRRVALRTCEVLGVPVTAGLGGHRPAEVTPRPSASPAVWLAARRQDARWARRYAVPWVRRRLWGTSSGDGLPPKRPDLLPVEPLAVTW
jgi:lysophospholipase L1-like esterase